ncbi:phage/plasmid primase, P4 family [Sulfitobacter delicatus]|uniref:Phage/plasmid primase, P4 family, C-terminal domain-containing protein n=1 Tax=Sulfitobacter delicatus TaxID=218672 RepID=A0A1G7RCP1_9RHOB|nr:phage/plasmid primase, P4 family [Sulfitobacter delicatus]SDG08502.1 phage/plasmid primase, P4 family, C-terminal domain-containing protein [Sulfitobacter delicatus]
MTPCSDTVVHSAVDPIAISTFCDVLFDYLEGFVPIRFLGETGTPEKTPHVQFPDVGDVARLLRQAAPRAAKEQRAVYVVPGTVARTGSARAADIIATGVILIDIDQGDIVAKRDHAARHLGDPTLEIASGGVTGDGQIKRHLYWRLTEAAAGDDLQRVAKLRATLATKLGGDGAFGSLHQPIRVAGTIHGKNGVRTPVAIITQSTIEHDLAEFEALADQMPALSLKTPKIDTGRHQRAGPSARELASMSVRSGGQDGVTRFEALSRMIGHWIRNVRSRKYTMDEAWHEVRLYNSARIDPPWEEPRLHREFQALLRKDIEKHGDMPERDAEMDAGPPECSEDALADRFADEHASQWRYLPAKANWFHWTGQVWKQDETREVRELARQACRAVASKCEKPGEARRIASDKTISACLRIATSDPRLATRVSDWDAHPMLLNTPSGIIDLQTGEVLAHDQNFMLSQMAGASPDQGCPRWFEFLDEITDGDRELQSYLSRLAGYCLTGSTQEQMFAFLHGDGANGKSVFLSTIAHVLGDYAVTATLDTFMASSNQRHLTELAGLQAARLVQVPETEQGNSWAEAKIKSVTGGERLRANFMRQDHFEFTPQFKLLIAGNHRPRIASNGEAMRRRLHIVPFDVTIPADRRDPKLLEALRMEADGILGWMLEGCNEWQRIGLAPPQRLLDTANSYFQDEDLVGQWISECCRMEPGMKAPSKVLFGSWKAWAEAAGVPSGSIKTFGEAMRSRGCRPISVKRARGWEGIALALAVPCAGGDP